LGVQIDKSSVQALLRSLVWIVGIIGLFAGVIVIAVGLYASVMGVIIPVLLDGGVLGGWLSMATFYLSAGLGILVIGVIFGYFGAKAQGTSLGNEVRAFLGGSTFRYIVRRLLYMIPVALGVSIISFMTMYAAGDPINIIRLGKGTFTPDALAALRAYYGLDKPIPIQYLNWLANLLQFNLGKSLRGGQPVNLIVGNWLWETAKLQLVSIGVALAISIPVGINSARKQYSKQDVVITSFSLFGVSMPTFWLGLILIIIFSFQLGWLPSEGAYGTTFLWGGNAILDQIAHLIMPVAVLVYVSLAQNIRLIRANMLEVLRSDYILAARASGLSERKIIYKYALRNAISPVITFLGISLGTIIAGAPMTEYVFNWPGLGRRFVEATTNLDFPVVMAITMIITVMALIANLIVDLVYVYVDPRIRLR
jgi:peptide/nickel transport system permease protein